MTDQEILRLLQSHYGWDPEWNLGSGMTGDQITYMPRDSQGTLISNASDYMVHEPSLTGLVNNSYTDFLNWFNDPENIYTGRQDFGYNPDDGMLYPLMDDGSLDTLFANDPQRLIDTYSIATWIADEDKYVAPGAERVESFNIDHMPDDIRAAYDARLEEQAAQQNQLPDDFIHNELLPLFVGDDAWGISAGITEDEYFDFLNERQANTSSEEQNRERLLSDDPTIVGQALSDLVEQYGTSDRDSQMAAKSALDNYFGEEYNIMGWVEPEPEPEPEPLSEFQTWVNSLINPETGKVDPYGGDYTTLIGGVFGRAPVMIAYEDLGIGYVQAPGYMDYGTVDEDGRILDLDGGWYTLDSQGHVGHDSHKLTGSKYDIGEHEAAWSENRVEIDPEYNNYEGFKTHRDASGNLITEWDQDFDTPTLYDKNTGNVVDLDESQSRTIWQQMQTNPDSWAADAYTATRPNVSETTYGTGRGQFTVYNEDTDSEYIEYADDFLLPEVYQTKAGGSWNGYMGQAHDLTDKDAYAQWLMGDDPWMDEWYSLERPTAEQVEASYTSGLITPGDEAGYRTDQELQDLGYFTPGTSAEDLLTEGQSIFDTSTHGIYDTSTQGLYDTSTQGAYETDYVTGLEGQTAQDLLEEGQTIVGSDYLDDYISVADSQAAVNAAEQAIIEQNRNDALLGIPNITALPVMRSNIPQASPTQPVGQQSANVYGNTATSRFATPGQAALGTQAEYQVPHGVFGTTQFARPSYSGLESMLNIDPLNVQQDPIRRINAPFDPFGGSNWR